jgi:16S rRNA pseudouridine516 synthase
MTDNPDKDDLMRIDRFLGKAGRGSRKEVRKAMKSGIVTINGAIVSDPGAKVSRSADIVEIGGERADYRGYAYLLMNKPSGVVSATEDRSGETTVTDLLTAEYETLGLSPVGRLDKDTTGLLLLTNDGAFNHRMTSPKKGVVKTYYAIVTGSFSESAAAAFAEGVKLKDGYVCASAELVELDPGDDSEFAALCREFSPTDIPRERTYEAIVRVSEGKYHQVKRMFGAAGQRTLYLKRVSFGEYKLPPGLKEGEFIEISP